MLKFTTRLESRLEPARAVMINSGPGSGHGSGGGGTGTNTVAVLLLLLLLLLAVRAALLLVAVRAALLLVAVRAALLLVAVRAALLLVAVGAALLLLAADSSTASDREYRNKVQGFSFYLFRSQQAKCTIWQLFNASAIQRHDIPLGGSGSSGPLRYRFLSTARLANQTAGSFQYRFLSDALMAAELSSYFCLLAARFSSTSS
ncbi:hypothetical protein EMCRGX_G027106 [Ephydatia muelleri]